jgi:glycosyltransferase involved in cell wall biosynthesis
MEKAVVKVLVLDEWIPYPLISGKRLRSYHLLSRAARSNDMTYLCFADPGRDGAADDSATGDEAARKHMESLGVRMVTLPRRDPFTPAHRLYTLAAANLLSARPLVMKKHFRKDYLAKLRELVAGEKFDLLHCEWTHYGAYARLIPGLPRFLSSHNIEAMPWQRLYRHEANPIKRAALYVEWKKMAAFEREVCRSFHHISAVSEDDRKKFMHDYGCESVTVIPNGVDVSYYDEVVERVGGVPANGGGQPEASGRPPGARSRSRGAHGKTLVFSASFDAFVNQDAVVYWMEAIWPRLLKELPAVRMLFLGKDPPRALGRYVSDKVQLTGTVPDVRPYLAQSSVCVVPLRVAGGSRIKILEAMAAGLPVVSTPEGAEGLDVVSGEHLLIARDVDEFVSGVAQLLHDEGMARYLAANGRKLVEERYDWQNIARLVPAAWEEAVRRFRDGRGADRQKPS